MSHLSILCVYVCVFVAQLLFLAVFNVTLFKVCLFCRHLRPSVEHYFYECEQLSKMLFSMHATTVNQRLCSCR